MVKGGRELIVLGVVAVAALVLLLVLFNASVSGQFVYAGNRVQLAPDEGCGSLACKDGGALVVNVRNTKFWQGPPQVADCVCPEDVSGWEGDKPVRYSHESVRTVRLIKNYNEWVPVEYD
ncbi:hypothetical protein HY490_05390 [Candidatus Woesearchaeota archaeon]|nr:hypothetical protein [Candidatus Woesearchaeota archaeon]